jgi:uncharacterized membrane-anchored protein
MQRECLSKVPEVTFLFWVLKVAATILGETGGDTVTMTLDWGYLAGVALFIVLLIALVLAQIRAREFQPSLYWATIVASTTFGTVMADFADRSLGIGYAGGSALLFACLIASLRALVTGHDLGNFREHRRGGGVLLGIHHFVTDAGRRVGRLVGR